MSPRNTHRSPHWAVASAWLVAGLALLLLSWALPVSVTSVTLPLLQAAGAGTPSVSQLGRQLVVSEKIGPAALVHAATVSLQDPGADGLQSAIAQLSSQQPEMVAWGGWDPFLDPLFKLRENKGHTASTPVLTFFITGQARETLRNYLANSRSLGVQAVLRTREIDETGRFIPALRAGGQPLDTVILLTALLYQGEHLSPSLQREIRTLADDATRHKSLGDLEAFYFDLLSLSKRLDWTQLSELLRHTDDAKTVSEYAQLARVAPADLPLIYAAALFSDSADRVASYLLQYGKSGLADLRTALPLGQGAVRQLLLRQVPLNRSPAPALGGAAEFGLLHPQLALVVKWLGFLAGAFCLLRGLDRAIFANFAAPGLAPRLSHLKGGVLSLLLGGLLVLATEPFLLRAAPPSEYKVKLLIPALSISTPATPAAQPSRIMDTSTLLSIGLFATLQIGMYLICLMKIREIARQPLSPLVKLKLMENEENLFDGGLYVGIAGTATALVLQVLRVIEPNLLAAYSSNLFGIICVALVKIRHVRPYKCALILEGQLKADVPVAPAPAKSAS
ncbi:MAG: hypothetical protein KBG39_11525 [Opitutaceae bacterium]|jgi:hypothetical protein|nr:hypothetical protein [Opitutaceae bacterium]